MFKYECTELLKKSLLSNHLLGAFLIFFYLIMYGISAPVVLYGVKLFYFLSSIAFAAFILYVRDPEIKREKIKQGILGSQVIGTVLVFSYLLFYGISSLTLLNGFQLIFFMSSYIFVMSLFYLRDPEKIGKEETSSFSSTGAFIERNPCFLNKNDLSWFVREVNSALSVLIGFTELLLKRECSESEKEYMHRNIYEQSLYISNCLNKVSATITDSPVRPKETHEVVDLLDDKNFR